MPDINGFDPFPHTSRFPGPDFWPGPYSVWAFTDYKNSEGYSFIAGRNSYPPEPPKKN